MPTTRTDWINADAQNRPQQTVIQLVNGAVGDRCVVPVNGDLFYQAFEPSIRSLLSAVRNFGDGQWGNTPISQNEERALQFNDRALMRFSSGIEFNNRILMAALPTLAADGINVIHQGILPLDFDTVTNLEEKKKPVWEGIYDGLQILQLFTGDFGGLPRAFAVNISDDDGSINVWELTTDQRMQNGDNRVTWSVEFPAYTFATSGYEYRLKQLNGGEVWIDKLAGTVEMDFYYRADAEPCWRWWFHHQICAARCEDIEGALTAYPCDPCREGYVFTVAFPEPGAVCNQMGVRPTTQGYQFQVKVRAQRLVPNSRPAALRAASEQATVPRDCVPSEHTDRDDNNTQPICLSMAARPFPSLCECAGADSPITNISAEAPDPLLFAGIPYNPYDPHAPPPLGDGPNVRVDCANFLSSVFAAYDPTVYAGTQLMANLMALAAELGCKWPPSGDQTFTNDAQSATVYCPDGTAFSYTVDAGTLTSQPMDAVLGSAWVDWANAWAAAYAYEQASALLDCVVPDDDTPDEPGPRKPTIPTGAGILPGPVWLCFGEYFFHRYTVSGRGASAYTLSISAGALPPGTTFTQDGPRTGYISGTPTAPGEYNYTITGVSTTLPTVTVEVTDYVWVMGITNASSLPDATAGTPYGPETLTATGGTAPYTFTSSNLPTGFSLTSAGVLTSDDTTVDGDYTFDVVLTDAEAGECIQTVLMPVNSRSLPRLDYSAVACCRVRKRRVWVF